jgi:zinc transport system substrate-binding protein
MNAFVKWSGALLLAIAGAGCDKTELPEQQENRQVYTTFYPTTYFTRRIAGDRVEVVCPLPPGEDPIFWMPDEETRRAYQDAYLVVINGAGFERWIDKMFLAPSKIVDTSKPLKENLLKFEGEVEHSHPSGKHSHEGIDGHTWLDPNHAKKQAREICSALAEKLPQHAEEFEANFAVLAGELDELHRSLEGLTGEIQGQHLLASHSAYNYLVERYDWNVTNLNLDPEAMPAGEMIAEIRNLLQDEPARIILWESRPAAGIAERLAEELNLKNVVFSPCESLTDEQINSGQDYLTVMRGNIDCLRAATSE